MAGLGGRNFLFSFSFRGRSDIQPPTCYSQPTLEPSANQLLQGNGKPVKAGNLFPVQLFNLLRNKPSIRNRPSRRGSWKSMFAFCTNRGKTLAWSPGGSWGPSPLANGSHAISQKPIIFMVVIRPTSVWILPQISRG